jgi:hypothetical protein
MSRRLLPVCSLFLLSPLIAEYLLGSMPVRQLAVLPILALVYGSGAILVREFALRLGGGVPRLVLLGFAYALVEEGLSTQSMFNPNYLHLRLLDFGFIPALGTSPVWDTYVLSLHVAWSIAVPIGLAESLFPAGRSQPWLGRIGLAVMGLLYVGGVLLITRFTHKMEGFVAPAASLVSVALLALLCLVAAWRWPRRVLAAPRSPTPPLGLFLCSLGLGSVFAATEFYGARRLHLGPGPVLAVLLACDAAALAVAARSLRQGAWSATQEYAFALGGCGVYGWLGFVTDAALHGSADLLGHGILCLFLLGIAAVAAVRARASDLRGSAA